MKKAFTLIELLITMVLGFIVLSFVFSFYFNFSKELKYLEAKERLAMESFKLSELLTKGLKNETYIISGVISLDDLKGGGKKFDDHDNHEIEFKEKKIYNIKYPEIKRKNEGSYIYQKVILDEKPKIERLKDKYNNNTDIYSITFDSTTQPDYKNLKMENPLYKNYQRLIYTR
jgi:prepilin-type N-terminal cleavage/methylation domain-containing protein